MKGRAACRRQRIEQDPGRRKSNAGITVCKYFIAPSEQCCPCRVLSNAQHDADAIPSEDTSTATAQPSSQLAPYHEAAPVAITPQPPQQVTILVAAAAAIAKAAAAAMPPAATSLPVTVSLPVPVPVAFTFPVAAALAAAAHAATASTSGTACESVCCKAG
jgi:hypothetical protein